VSLQGVHCRTKLSPSARLVESLGKYVLGRAGNTGQREEEETKSEKQQKEHQGQRRSSVLEQISTLKPV